MIDNKTSHYILRYYDKIQCNIKYINIAREVCRVQRISNQYDSTRTWYDSRVYTKPSRFVVVVLSIVPFLDTALAFRVDFGNGRISWIWGLPGLRTTSCATTRPSDFSRGPLAPKSPQHTPWFPRVPVAGRGAERPTSRREPTWTEPRNSYRCVQYSSRWCTWYV